MKRLILATALLLALTAPRIQAQTFMDRIHFEAAASAGSRNQGLTPIDFSFKTHVDFISITYLFVTVEDNVALYKNRGVKTYWNSVSLGGGLGVKLLDGTNSIHALDLRAKALDSVGDPAWERTTYDITLAWYIKEGQFSPIVELGYRYHDSHTKGLANIGNAFLSIGIRY